MKRIALALTITIALLFTVAIGTRVVNLAFAQDFEAVTIKADGSIDPSTTPIQRNGDVYTLTGSISVGIRVQKSYIVIDGAGYAVEGSGEEVGIDLSANYSYQSPIQINNVTVKNLRIVDCYVGISSEGSHNNSFIGNYVVDCDTAFWITGSSNNTLRYNTVKDCVTGISINYAGKNVITENNIINNSLLVWLSTEPLVDRNYWSDYLTRYPDAKEIVNTGIWNTPYDYGGSLGNYTDDHPLTQPVVVPSNDEPLPISLVLAVSGAALAVVGIGLLVYFKKSKR